MRASNQSRHKVHRKRRRMQRKHGRWGRGLDSAAFTGQPLDPFATQNQVNQHFLPSHYTSTHLGLSSWPIRTDRTDQSMVPWTEAGTRQCESLRDAHATRHARMGARPRGRAGRSGHRIGGSERRSNGWKAKRAGSRAGRQSSRVEGQYGPCFVSIAR